MRPLPVPVGRRPAVLLVVIAVLLTACGGRPSTESTATPSPEPTTRTVQVFFTNVDRGDPCTDVFPVEREVPAAAPLRGALESLLAGPTDAERAEGYSSWFSEATADLLAGVRIEDDVALVSFRTELPEVIPNASSSCGSTSLLASLDATVTQFPEVDTAIHDLEGDRTAFYGWLQLAAPGDKALPEPTPTISPTPSPRPGPTPEPDPRPPAPPDEPALPPLSADEWTTLPASAGRVVALTFDAGANADAVPSILSTLSTTGTPGTFFLTGQWTTAYPQYAATIGARHAVGNHTQTHPDLTTLSDAAVTAQVLDAQRVINRTADDDPRPWFRFPFGARDSRTLDLVGDLGYRSVRWTVDTLGWKGTSGGITRAEVVDRVMGVLQPGAIVLMHVGSNPTDGSTLDADALPEIIRRVRSAGYRLVDLDDIAPQ